jgi:uncharacterized protein with HEPN domain
MPHDLRASVWDAVKACRAIQNTTAGLDLRLYSCTEVVRLATERAFEILGEALKRVDDADKTFRGRIPEIGKAIGMRNYIAHEYDVVDDATVWKVAMNDVPPLMAKLEAWLEANG